MTAGTPWSTAAGIRCVPIRPFVESAADEEGEREQPERARAGSEREPAERVAHGRRHRHPLLELVSAVRRQPDRLPAVAHRRAPTSGITSSTPTTATQIAAAFQPYCRTSSASAGRNTSWPVAFAAVMMPVTRPRRRTNQRCATIAASGTDTARWRSPITTPHSSCSCHGCEILIVVSDATATIAERRDHTRRIPKRSCSAAANGAARPKHTRLIETAERDRGAATSRTGPAAGRS